MIRPLSNIFNKFSATSIVVPAQGFREDVVSPSRRQTVEGYHDARLEFVQRLSSVDVGAAAELKNVLKQFENRLLAPRT